MGTTLYCKFYPKECNNPNVKPFLEYYESAEQACGKLPTEFYMLCNEYGEWDEDNKCWVFENIEKLYEFAGKPEVPAFLSDFIIECRIGNTNMEYKDGDILIIWKR